MEHTRFSLLFNLLNNSSFCHFCCHFGLEKFQRWNQLQSKVRIFHLHVGNVFHKKNIYRGESFLLILIFFIKRELILKGTHFTALSSVFFVFLSFLVLTTPRQRSKENLIRYSKFNTDFIELTSRYRAKTHTSEKF